MAIDIDGLRALSRAAFGQTYRLEIMLAIAESTAGGRTWAARIPNRVAEPPALYREMLYAPIEPTRTESVTVRQPTMTLRPAAPRMPELTTTLQFSRVGAKAS